MNELTLKDAIQELEELSTGNWIPYEYSPEEAKLILNHINNLQSKIDKANMFIDKYLEIVDNPDINMQCVKDILKKED
jgi:hypothetical protein